MINLLVNGIKAVVDALIDELLSLIIDKMIGEQTDQRGGDKHAKRYSNNEPVPKT
ncbi:hypothetical protein PCURB6_40230 [Paenibacillus curdlanolyticus]|nr:hypothetical protein PCURB6_40230 [Paenibacillus curdlanolyticus]